MAESINEEYRYYAFISYSKRKREAKKLQSKIEAYRLPTVLRTEIEKRRGEKCPKKVYPIFRDDSDLPAGELNGVLRRELEKSKYLIVVCSPEAAQSVWVNREIEEFILMGRYERIIPYIVAGIPNSSNPAEEAFPPILRKNRGYISYDGVTKEQNEERQSRLRHLLEGFGELKGLSVENEGGRDSRLKTIARILEIEPDLLIQRDRRRRKRNNLIRTAILLMVCMIGLFVWNRYFRTHVNYYANYIERWCLPVGIDPLSKNAVHNRWMSWRIKTRNGRVRELDCVGPDEKLINPADSEYTDRFAHVVFNYEGKSTETYSSSECYDDHGNRIFAKNLTVLPDKRGHYLVNFKKLIVNSNKGDTSSTQPSGTNNGQFGSDIFFNSNTLSSALNQGVSPTSESKNRFNKAFISNGAADVISPVSVYEIECYPNSLEGMRIYKDSESSEGAIQDADGTNGRVYDYDARGRTQKITCIRYVDGKLEETNNAAGYSQKIYTYDDDHQGGIKSVEYRTVDGKYCYGELGCCKSECEYDEWGNYQNEYFYAVNEKGELKPCNNYYGFSSCCSAYFHGRRIRCEYFDTDCKTLCLNKDGYAGYNCEYDSLVNQIRCEYFGTDGKTLRLHKDGIAGYNSEYDSLGNQIRCEFFGTDGKTLCLSNDGIAGWDSGYDSLGREIRREFFGVNGEKVALRSDPFDSWESKYENGKLKTKEWFYSIQPTSKGFLGSERWTYDPDGNVCKKEFFDQEGNLYLENDEEDEGEEVNFF